jgi:glutathione synthase/RimK-type ligase-like ATP-grasp enzyme
MITPKEIQVEKTLKELLKDIEKFGIDVVKTQLNYYVNEINEFKECPTISCIGTAPTTAGLIKNAHTTLTHPYFPTFLE